jgi:hypothetical protein
MRHRCASLRALPRMGEGTSGTTQVMSRSVPSVHVLKVWHSTPEGFCLQGSVCMSSCAASPVGPDHNSDTIGSTEVKESRFQLGSDKARSAQARFLIAPV